MNVKGDLSSQVELLETACQRTLETSENDPVAWEALAAALSRYDLSSSKLARPHITGLANMVRKHTCSVVRERPRDGKSPRSPGVASEPRSSGIRRGGEVPAPRRAERASGSSLGGDATGSSRRLLKKNGASLFPVARPALQNLCGGRRCDLRGEAPPKKIDQCVMGPVTRAAQGVDRKHHSEAEIDRLHHGSQHADVSLAARHHDRPDAPTPQDCGKARARENRVGGLVDDAGRRNQSRQGFDQFQQARVER